MLDVINAWESEFRENIKKYRFFDANCWYGMSNQPTLSLVPDIQKLLQVMQDTGLKKVNTCSFLSKFLKPHIGNRSLIQDIASLPEDKQQQVVPSIVLIPWMFREAHEAEVYLDDMIGQGVLSVRMFPKTHNYLLTEWSNPHMLKMLEDRRVPLFIRTKDYSWEQVYELSKGYPKLPIIVEQCDVEAFFNLGYIRPLLQNTDNVYLETNRMHEYAALDVMVEEFSGSRFVFGSNIPIDDPYAQVSMIIYGQFSEEDKYRIAHENLERLFSEVRR